MYKTLAFYVTLLRKDFTNYCHVKLEEMGLSQGLLFFILYVGKHPGCSQKELASALHMDTGHVTRSLMKLEQGEFLKQENSEKDRRVHTLELLEKGEQAFQISHQLFSHWDDVIMKKLSDDEQNQLMGLLKRLVEDMDNNDCAKWDC